MRYRRDRSWRQPGDRGVIVAGSPLRLFRVSKGGANVLDAALIGEQPPTRLVDDMLARFVDAGALHPEPEVGPYTAADVTVVVPVHGAAPLLSTGVPVIVVDDASDPPISVPGATVVRLDVNRGPAAARNAGLAMVTSSLVAFLDADVDAPHDWLAPLLVHFADPRVALVAPRVSGAPGDGVLAQYEQRHSPLDLGDEPARIAAGTRVSYVPAAALVCRVDVLRSLGGFDEDMRVGEDVDLVWRLVDAGHRARYEPASVVHHRPRATVGAMLRQRMGYGRSAAALAERHPGALAPVRMSGWSLAAWVLLGARRPWIGAATVVGTTAALVRKLRDVPPQESARLALLGHLGAGRQLASGVTRVWWPVALVASIVSRRVRTMLAVAFLAPVAAAAVRERSVQPVCDAPLRWADEMAYGVGLWQGVVTRREPGPLLPDLSGWPPRGDG